MEVLKLSKNTAKLHQMFGPKLYSNKYSFISELCQNAVDSHRMAGEKDPVKVGIGFKPGSHGKSYGNMIFYVMDTGLSFEDEDDFLGKVLTILESGKTAVKTADENCAMGEHGIGSISVSAYQKKWKYEVVTTKKRRFTCELEFIEGKGLHYEFSRQKPCDEYKSVYFEVAIAVNDLHPFVNNMRSKLAYFKDILFEIDPDIIKMERSLLTINTDFQLFQAEHLQVSTLSTHQSLHISLDQYSYPINWEHIGIERIPLNIALKFTMADGLVSDITRENLIIDENYKKIILDKIKIVATWMVERYNLTIQNPFTSFKLYQKAAVLQPHVTINNYNYPLQIIQRHSNVPVKKVEFKDVSEATLNEFSGNAQSGNIFFNVQSEIKESGIRSTSVRWQNRFNHSTSYLWDTNKTIPAHTLRYIKAEQIGAGIYTELPRIIQSKKKNNTSLVLGLLFKFVSKSDLRNCYFSTGRNLWREKVNEINILIDSYKADKFIKIEDIKIPKEFVHIKRTKYQKEKVDISNLSGEITIRFSKAMSINGSFNCKFEPSIVKIKDLSSQPFIVYGTEDQRRYLDRAYCITAHTKGNNIHACIISERDQKHLSQLNLTNFMKIEDFLAGKHPHIRKTVTAYRIKKLRILYSDIFSNIDIITNHVSKEFGQDLLNLVHYSKDYKELSSESQFLEDLVTLADASNLYDTPVFDIYNKVKSDIENFDFVKIFNPSLSNGRVDNYFIKILNDIKITRSSTYTWKNYKI